MQNVLGGLVSSILVKYLGQYVDGINKNELKLGVWSGEVQLSNLRIKRDVLNTLSLPVHIKAGFVGRIKIVVPWHHLQSRQVEAHVEQIHLVVGPKKSSDFSEDAERRKEQLSKQERLSRAEIMRKSRAAIGAEAPEENETESGDDLDTLEPSSPWFYERWISNVVDNVQVSISDIHIRYEDDESIPGRCFSAGLTLDSIKLHSTDSNWMAGFVSQISDVIFKALELNNLAVYVNPMDEPLCDEAEAPTDFAVAASRLAERMKALIFKPKQEFQPLAYILKPLSAAIRLRLNKSARPNPNIPKTALGIEIEDISLGLNDVQYGSIMVILDRISTLEVRSKFRRYRPSVSPTANPRAWWRYLREIFLGDVQKKSRKYSWDNMAKRRQQRTKYIKLWQRKMLLRNMSRVSDSTSEDEFDPADKYRLEALERELSAEDILYFRALADARLRSHLDHLGIPWLVEMAKPSQARAGLVSNAVKWIGSFWGGGKASDATKELPTVDEILDSLNRNKSSVGQKITSYLMQEIPFEWVPSAALSSAPRNSAAEKEVNQKKRAWLALMDAMYVETELQLRIGGITASLALLGDNAATASSGSDSENLFDEDFIIQKGEFEGHAQERSVTSLVITSVAVDVKLRPKFSNTGVTASIQSIQILDLCSPMQGVYPGVLRSLLPKSSSASASASLGSSTPLHKPNRKQDYNSSSSLTSSSTAMSSWTLSSSSLSSSSGQLPPINHFLKAVFELNPISREANQPFDAAFCLALACLPLEINANIPLIAEVLKVFKGAGLVELSRNHDLELAGSLTLDKIKRDHHLSLKSSQEKLVEPPKEESKPKSAPPSRMIIDANLSIRLRIIDSKKSGGHLLFDIGSVTAVTPGLPQLLSSRSDADTEDLARRLHTNRIDLSVSGMSLSIRRDPTVRKARGRDSHSDVLHWILERTAIGASLDLFSGDADKARLLKRTAATAVAISVSSLPLRVSTGGVNSLLGVLASVLKDVQLLSQSPKDADQSSIVAGQTATQPPVAPRESLPSLRLQVSIEHLVVILAQTASAEVSIVDPPLDSSSAVETDILYIDLSAIAASILLGSNTSVQAKIGGFDIIHRPSGSNMLTSSQGPWNDLAHDSNLLISPRDGESDLEDVSAKLESLRSKQVDFVRASVTLAPGSTRVGISVGSLSLFIIAPFIRDILVTVKSFAFSALASGGSPSKPPQQAPKANVEPATSALNVTLSLKEVSIVIGKEKPQKDVVRLAVEGVSTQLHQQAESLELRANLSAIRVDDLREEAKHTRILAPLAHTERLLDIIYASPAASDAFIPLAPLHSQNVAEVSYQQLIRARLEPFRVLVVRGFIDDVLATVNEIVASLPQSQPQTTQNDEIPRTIEQQPVSSVSSVPADPSFLKFEVVASHPQVILPRHSTHSQVLLFDLGDIVARNHVAAISQKSTRQDVNVKMAMESEILLTVTGANCQITELDQEHYSQRVIDQIKLFASVKKLDWLASPAELDVHGLAPLKTPLTRVASEISELKLSLTDEHIQTLLVAASSLSSSSAASAPAQTLSTPDQQHAAQKQPSLPPKDKTESPNPAGVLLAVSVHLKHFSVDLGKAAPHPHNKLARKVVPLVSFSIDKLFASVGQTGNGTTTVMASIRSIAIRDSKPRSKNVFKQLIGPARDAQPALYGLASSGSFTPLSASGSEWDTESTGTSEAGSSSSGWEPAPESSRFLSVGIVLDPSSGKTSVRAQISNPRIIVVPSVIFDLVAFLDIATTIVPSDEFERAKFSNSASAAPAEQPQPPAPPKRAQENSNGPILDISADINSLEICIVRDPSSSKTQAIVLRTSLGAKVLSPSSPSLPTPPSSLAVQAFIRQFQVYKCFMHRMDQTALSLIDPFDGVVRFYSLREEPRDCVHVGLNPITIKFSHQDILLGTAIGKTFERPPAPLEAPPPKPDQPFPASKTYTGDAPPSRKFSTKVLSAGLQVILIDDLQGRNVPLVSVHVSELDSSVALTSRPSSMKVKLDLTLEASYYNLEGANWEPVVEKWPASVLLLQKSDPEPSLGISIFAQHILNANVTSSLVSTITRLTRSLQDQLENLSAQESPALISSARASLHPFVLKNNTGMKISYWTDKIRSPLELNADNWAPLVFKSSRGLRKMRVAETDAPSTPEEAVNRAPRLAGPQARLSLQLGDRWLPIKDIPVTRPGSRLIELSSDPLMVKSSTSSNRRFAVVDVDTAGNSLVVNVRSHVSLRNMCASRSIRVGPKSYAPLQHRKVMPGDSFSLPFEWLDFLERGELTVDYKPISLDRPESFSPYSGVTEYTSHRIWTQAPSLSSGRSESSTALSVAFSSGASKRVESHHSLITINVLPSLRIENRLPETMEFYVLDKDTGLVVAEQTVASGEDFEIFHEDHKHEMLLKVRLEGYQWSSFTKITSLHKIHKQSRFTPKSKILEERFDHVLRLRDDQDRILYLDVDFGMTKPPLKSGSLLANAVASRSITIYSQYWLINKSGLPLIFRPSHSEDSASVDSVASGQTRNQAMANRLAQEDPSRWYTDTELVQRSEKPILFSPGSPELVALSGQHSLQVRALPTSWSAPINIGTVGHSGNVFLQLSDSDSSSDGGFQLGVHIELGTPSKFFRTKVVTFTPQFVLVNASSKRILYKQKLQTSPSISSNPIPFRRESSEEDLASLSAGADISNELFLEPKERRPFHWTGTAANSKKGTLSDRSMCIRLADSLWSGSFSIDSTGDFSLNLRNSLNEIVHLALIQVRIEKGCSFVIIKEESSEYPPYRIDNMTSERIRVYQKGQKRTMMVLKPQDSQPYAWEEPGGEHVLVVEIAGKDVKSHYPLDRIDTTFPAIALDNHVHLQAQVVPEGPTRVFKLIDTSRHPTSLPAPVERKRKILDPSQKIDFSLDLRGIAVSVIDSQPQRPRELLLVCLERLGARYISTAANDLIELKLQSLQIDNQAFGSTARPHQGAVGYTFPVVLSSAASHLVLGKPLLHISVVKSKSFNDVDYFQYASAALQEIHLKLDRTLLEDIIGFVDQVSAASEAPEATHRPSGPSAPKPADGAPAPSSFEDPALVKVAIPDSAHAKEKKVYFEALHLHPIRLNLSFASTSAAPVAPDAHTSNIGLSGDRVLRAIGVSLGNLDGVALYLNSILIEHPFSSKNELLGTIGQHYKMELIRQMYKFLGAIDVLGSPMSLVSNLSTGVYDFVYDPLQSLVTSPQDVVQGFAKGTSSLIINSIYGITNSASKITGSIEKAISQLTPSVESQHQRDTYRYLSSSQAMPNVIAQGARSLGSSIVETAKGLVALPVEGWREGGPTGFINGVVNGVADIALRPSLAVVQFVHQSAESLRSVAAPIARLRFRPPRMFPLPPGSVGDLARRPPLTPFALRFALGNFVFEHFVVDETPAHSSSSSIDGDASVLDMMGHYEWHWTSNDGERWWFVTNVGIMHCSVHSSTTLKIKWFVFFGDLKSIDYGGDSTSKIVLRVEESKYFTNLLGEPKLFYTIKFDDPSVARSVFQELVDFLGSN